MSIDLKTETPVPLTDVPNLQCIPRRRKGRKLAKSTPFRWAHLGIGGVRLEVIRVGGTLCTSVEALQRFFERLAIADRRQPVPSLHHRQQQLAQIDDELDRAGI